MASVAPDEFVLVSLQAKVDALLVDDADHRAMFDAMFDHLDSDATRSRVWAYLLDNHPDIRSAYPKDQPPKPPFWRVFLMKETWKPVVGNLITSPPRKTIAGSVYQVYGCQEEQLVQVRIWERNDEQVRAQYRLVKALMFQVAHDVAKQHAITGTPLSGGEYMPNPMELDPEDLAGRYLLWQFYHETEAYVPASTLPTDVQVVRTT